VWLRRPRRRAQCGSGVLAGGLSVAPASSPEGTWSIAGTAMPRDRNHLRSRCLPARRGRRDWLLYSHIYRIVFPAKAGNQPSGRGDRARETGHHETTLTRLDKGRGFCYLGSVPTISRRAQRGLAWLSFRRGTALIALLLPSSLLGVTAVSGTASLEFWTASPANIPVTVEIGFG